MGIGIDKPVKQHLIFFSLLLMLVALFTSRALLTISFSVFVSLTCFHKDFVAQLTRFIKNPFLVGMSLLFFIPLITWFWTDDKQMWARFARIKLPLFLFPLAFAGNWQLSDKQWRWVAYSFLALLFAGSVWSLWHYALDAEAINKDYLKAKVIRTPLNNDYVRFSLLVSVAVVCSVLLIKNSILKSVKIILGSLAIFFVIYLHILSARTGLITLYIFFLAGLFYLGFFFRRRWTILLLAGILLMPPAAWYLFPTFQNRIRYILYGFSFIRDEKYLPGTSDGNRMISYKAGWNVLKENPFGVGGDVVTETNKWYDNNVPALSETDKIFPSSELFMYAAFAGWIGLILFISAMVIPLFQKMEQDRFFWINLNLIMAFSFLFDIGLEAQFGVFIYSFIVLWWWKALNNTAVKTA